MGFYNIGSRGTVTGPAEFDAEAAAKKLYEGMKGLGTDENVIVEVIGTHTNEQRQEIKDKYKTMYGKDLNEDFESELGGSFAKIVQALMKQPEEFIVSAVHDAIAGMGTDEYSLIGLLCVRTNDELEELKKAYKEKYEKDMEDDVSDDLSGNFRALMIGLINGGRDEGEDIDIVKAEDDAKNLLTASSGLGTSEEVYQSVFNQRSHPHMRAVFDAFKELAEGKEIEETIESEFSGTLQTAYLAFVKIFRDITAFHCDRIRHSIKKFGTDDETLIQIIVTRAEIDLQDIIEAYQEKYESGLFEDISSDVSGDYRLILQRILVGAPETEEAAVDEAVGEDAAGEEDE